MRIFGLIPLSSYETTLKHINVKIMKNEMETRWKTMKNVMEISFSISFFIVFHRLTVKCRFVTW